MAGQARHKKSVFVELMTAFVPVCLWGLFLILLNSYTGFPGEVAFDDALQAGKIAVLVVGIFPLFLIFWIAGDSTAAIGRPVCRFLWSSAVWIYSLQDLFQWPRVWPIWLARWASMTVALPFLLPFTFVVAFAIFDGWPINLSFAFVVGSCALAHFAAESNGRYELIGKAGHSCLLPIAFGLWAVLWIQLFLNLFDEDSSVILKYENRVAYLSAKSKAWFDFSIPASIALAVCLILLAFIIPKLQPATRILSIKSFGTKAAALLACASSFTFLVQSPFKYQDLREARRIQAEKRRGGNQNTDKAAIYATTLAIRSLQLEDIRYYRSWFEEMSTSLPYREHGRVMESMVHKLLSSNAPGTPKRMTTQILQFRFNPPPWRSLWTFSKICFRP